jgi:ABC-type Fe3+/spermidine/putrescine transport system ATPase subunit
MSDWIAVMNAGRVEQWGTPWQIYYHPRTPFLADFVGAVNLLPATVVASGPNELVVTLGEQRLRLPPLAEPAGERVLFCIRPESVTLAPDRAEAGAIHLPGTVNRTAFLGHLLRAWVQVGDQEWIVDQPDPGGAGPPPDGPVTLAFHPRRVHVIVPPA